MAAAAATAPDKSAFTREDGSRRRVLYAEDQASARVVTTALLERMGFDVVAVEDGELALEQARRAAYDVILLDIEMPVMDGVTAARCIRAEQTPCTGVPILALSAFLADSTEHSHWRDAFDSALPKPANSNELQTAMQRALAGRPQPSPAALAGPAPTWVEFGRALPRGTLAMLVRAAAQELNHLVLVYASCLEAGDAAAVSECRGTLRKVAASFQAHEVVALAAAETRAATAQELFQAVARWQATHQH